MEKSYINHIRVQLLFRILASTSTFVACLLMAFNKESRDFGGFQVIASYKSSPAFEFFVIGNAMACGYSLISLPFVYKFIVEGYTLPLLDLVSMGLVMASASAATTIGYLGKRGNDAIGWGVVCPFYGKFCDRIEISIVFSFLGFIMFFLMCSISSVYKSKQIASA